MLTLSIVSHGQAGLIRLLLEDLEKFSSQIFKVIITLNIPEDEVFSKNFSYPILIIRNTEPKGFGANHNFAFRQSKSEWFAIVNPDIRIYDIDFHNLLTPFEDVKVAAVAPLVLSVDGTLEDSARRFPTFFNISKRVLFRSRTLDYKIQEKPFLVDWVAGMFVAFRSIAFQQVNGFDDRRFFMYLEDADICKRLTQYGWSVIVNPSSQVVHVARRASRKNFKHFRWHIFSLLRYLTGV